MRPAYCQCPSPTSSGSETDTIPNSSESSFSSGTAVWRPPNIDLICQYLDNMCTLKMGAGIYRCPVYVDDLEMTPIRGPEHDGGSVNLGRANGCNSPYQSGRSQCNTLTRSNNPRPPYLAATDYIFYIKRQTAACQAALKSTGAHEASMEELTNFTDLMRRLKDDLKSSYTSFVEEFDTEPNDGVGLLLELLKIYRRGNQQEHLGHPLTLRKNKDRQQIIKKNMSEELDCIECIFYTLRCKKSLTKLVAHSSGMTSVASSVMSTCTTTRKLALQLMSRVIEEHPAGYQKVMDSISAVRVIHGETVRFKFLVSMLLNRSKLAAGFELAALRFLNCVHTYTPSASDKIRMQNELDEAGFDTSALEKNLFEKGFSIQDPVWDEVRRWKENFLNVEHVLAERKKVKHENTKLKTELELLRRALRRLEVDKISLMTIEKELKERCESLEIEVCALKKAAPSRKSLAKSSDTEDSDHSDNTQGTTDSGRSSFKDYAHRKLRANSRAGHSTSSGSAAVSPTIHSPDHQQSDSGGEETDLLQIPTIRPPEGFTTDHEDLVVEPTKVSVVGYVEKLSGNPSVPPSGMLRNESDIDWNYPIIPEPKVLNSRPPSRAQSATFSVASSSNARTMSTISNC